MAIATPSGTIRLQGTWISATYDPERRVALFVVFDGKGAATPVLDDAGQRIGEPTALDAGQFWFTVPGDAPVEIAGVPSRQALPLDRLAPIIRELHLESAFASIARQAETDGIGVRGMPDLPVVTVRLGGRRFADPDAGLAAEAVEAVLRAYDWRDMIGSILGRDDFAAYVAVGKDPLRDLLPITKDAEAAANSMLKAGFYNALITWDPSPELDKIASTYIDELLSVHFEATDARQSNPQKTAATVFNEFTVDLPVIWLDYRP